ncbi:hypothetical protein AHF37_06180 [Paragonimus kellicotti]|nr:hypothetical protein AHF37_06180 [Paragonimus kellicotti]
MSNDVTTQTTDLKRQTLESSGNDRPRDYRYDKVTLQPTLEHTQPIAIENQLTFQTSDISGPKPFKKPRTRNTKDQNNPFVKRHPNKYQWGRRINRETRRTWDFSRSTASCIQHARAHRFSNPSTTIFRSKPDGVS